MTTTVDAPLLNDALELAMAGWAVFPCNPDKSPRIGGGFHNASSDPDVVTYMPWGDGALIGAAVPEGTIVVDVDPRNGGESTMAVLEDMGKRLPVTRAVGTRSGGLHYYLRVPDGVSLRGGLGPGVDIKRAGKGYVVVPPSAGYTEVCHDLPAEAPAWLLEELTLDERSSPEGVAGDARFFAAFEDGSPYGLGALDREIGRLVQAGEGGRNNALNAAAFSLAQLVAGGELSETRAKGELATAALLIGLEPSETRATIESGWGAGEAEPRQAPPKVEVESLGSATPNPTIVGDDDAEARFWVDWAVDEEPPPFYLHPLLPQRAYVIVYGSTEAAKSMTWMGLLCGGSRHGVRSSVYSLENPPSVDRDRLRRWGPDPANLRLTNQPIDFNDPRQLEALIKREKDWGANVVLIDTYSHAFNSRSEDGNAKAIDFARRVRWVMHEVECSVVVIDHTGYSQEDEPRDASAKRQQVDVAILMKKSGTWRHGEPARFTMDNKKAARFANPFFYNGAIRDTTLADGGRGLELAWTGDEPRWT